MSDLISKSELYKKVCEWEAQALHMCKVTMKDEDKTEWRKWSAILKDRSAFKFDVADAPTIDAVPVVRCKDCIYYCKSDKGHPDADWCKRLICGTMSPDFHCADGERGENE